MHNNYKLDVACNLEPEQVISVVEQTLSVQREFFLSRGQRNNVARKIAIYLIKKFTHLDNREITVLFGDLHYTSVAKLCRRFEQELKQDSKVREMFEKVKSELKIFNWSPKPGHRIAGNFAG